MCGSHMTCGSRSVGVSRHSFQLLHSPPGRDMTRQGQVPGRRSHRGSTASARGGSAVKCKPGSTALSVCRWIFTICILTVQRSLTAAVGRRRRRHSIGDGGGGAFFEPSSARSVASVALEMPAAFEHGRKRLQVLSRAKCSSDASIGMLMTFEDPL